MLTATMDRLIIFLILFTYSIDHSDAIARTYSDSIDYYNNKDTSIRFINSPADMPEFPGGESALLQFIASNLKVSAVDLNCSSRTIIGFVVEQTGELSNFKILRSSCPNLDKAAMDVMSKSPRWKPGRDKGKNVRAYMNLPITVDYK